MYTAFTLQHVSAVVFGHHQVISIQSHSTFSAIPPSIGLCLHLGEGHVCCIHCKMPVIDLKHINIKCIKTLGPLLYVIHITNSFKLLLQVLNFFTFVCFTV
jgi:hypothetical protein